jgi:DNA oxidative demethylase
MRTFDLFQAQPNDGLDALGPRAFVLRSFAAAYISELLPAIQALEQAAPFRHMVTPSGYTMSVAMTNCGRLGWVTDRTGYRYSETDPDTHHQWPVMPPVFRHLAQQAAAAAGFVDFNPDACLVNRYVHGNRLSLHQDKNERDLNAPIVSVSLGMSAVFLFGGLTRRDRPARVPLMHGDVVVWGGEDRLRFHGVMPLKDNPHTLLGGQRINLTFRKAV